MRTTVKVHAENERRKLIRKTERRGKREREREREREIEIEGVGEKGVGEYRISFMIAGLNRLVY